MKEQLTGLTPTDLLALRQWLSIWAVSNSISRKHSDVAAEMIVKIDQELWMKFISDDTPWLNLRFEDQDFEKTLEELRINRPAETNDNPSQDSE